ncbi:MAG: hypothetical protein ACP5N2_01290 [Candidatus Nanoarchaeia archaeon]
MKTLDLVLLGLLAYSCSTKTPELQIDQRKDSTELKLATDVMSKEDSINEQILQKGFYDLYVEPYNGFFGNRLYTNKELLTKSFKPSQVFLTSTRVWHYFLRNGKEETLEAAEKLGAKHKVTVMTEDYSLTRLFEKVGIRLEGDSLDWLEIPLGRSGGIDREKKYFLGEDEWLLTVESLSDEPDNYILEPARKAGYIIDREAEFRGIVVNELSHEIQAKYFKDLFIGEKWDTLSEPFASFKTEVPGLRFYNNAQAGEFLSDVATWVECKDVGVCDRFFNPLFNMSPEAWFNQGVEDRYAFSYEVQKYAMAKVLKSKGYKNPKATINKLVDFAANSDNSNHDELFIMTRKYFQEEDFKEIAEIYERIGVELLKTMQPYFKD